MGINSTEVSYNFGQLGSVFTNASSDAIKPPTNKVFIAITMVTDTVFDSTGGLIAGDENKFISTDHQSGDLADGSETTDEGSGGKNVDSIIFPAGLTIYGRWTEIDINSGDVIAYIGD